MSEHDAAPGDRPDYNPPPEDTRYLGPFAPAAPVYSPPVTPSTYPLTAGSPSWAPPTVTPPPLTSAPPRRSRTARPAAVIGIAAATALLVGGGAGYGGATLARVSEPAVTAPATPAPLDPSPEPSVSATTTAPLPPAPAEANTVAIAKRALPSTVMIEVGSSTGSGFVSDTDGHIITNNHVVAAATQGRKIRVVFRSGQRQSATLVGRSPSYDIAVIKVKASPTLKPMAVGNSDQTEVGQPVVAIGAPLGLPGTVTQGIVSAINRPVLVGGGADADSPTAYINGIQTDAPINPGNSGGPLLDAAARVIGVNSAILTIGDASQQQTGNIGLGFAIPINQAQNVARQLIEKGRATYPVIGANVATADNGVELTSVEDRGPAAKAGLRKGDVIRRIDSQSVVEMEELVVAIRTRRPGEVVSLDYRRGTADNQVKVTLGSKVG